MAIACEVAVKQTYSAKIFAKPTPAGAAYEYLEDKGLINASIPNMIHPVAKKAFGKSFMEDEKSHYHNIEFLFRCRNKVAHRGELVYKDNSDRLCSVDKGKLVEWWESAEILRVWLQTTKAKEIEATEPAT